ncbi:MAG: hypothetical protein MUE53_08845 [Chitinophagales bacterium]|jgi:hypothetical protein|nr:hypothetical protein [Chitinophagales bacterium]
MKKTILMLTTLAIMSCSKNNSSSTSANSYGTFTIAGVTTDVTSVNYTNYDSIYGGNILKTISLFAGNYQASNPGNSISIQLINTNGKFDSFNVYCMSVKNSSTIMYYNTHFRKITRSGRTLDTMITKYHKNLIVTRNTSNNNITVKGNVDLYSGFDSTKVQNVAMDFTIK